MSKTIDYVFKFGDGQEHRFSTELDAATLAIVPKANDPMPDWTLLSFQQCAGCPLTSATHPRCPVAANLTEIAEFFKTYVSYEEVDVTVVTEQRTYSKHTSVEEGLASLLEIYLVGSGCPVMDKMRPVIDNHLPFATPQEATWQHLTAYLTAQYLLAKKDIPGDVKADALPAILNELKDTSTAFMQRLKAMEKKDALRNSMVVLTNLITMAGRAIVANRFQRIEAILLPEKK